MSVQFAAIPVRALADVRLTGSDFRLLGAIARYDRFGRNGTGCYVNARQLAQDASVHYKHLGRQTQRLEAFGYITIVANETDRRRNIYSVIYDEPEIVTYAGDKSAGDDGTGDTVSPVVEKVTTSGDNPAEKVTNANSQVVDPHAKSSPKRLSEAYLRNPAKPRARNGEIAPQSEPQGHLKCGPHALKWRNQLPRNQPSAPDWNGWAAWLQSYQGMTKKAAWDWLDDTIENIKTERGVDREKACAVLDRQLKRQRKVMV